MLRVYDIYDHEQQQSLKKSDCKYNRLQYFLCWWISLA